MAASGDPEVSVTAFGVNPADMNKLQVTYDVLNDPVGPFTINVYRSLDGTTPISGSAPLLTHNITGNTAVGNDYTALIAADFVDLQEDYFLLAKVELTDGNTANNSRVFDGGVFRSNNVIHVQTGSLSDADTVTIAQNGTDVEVTWKIGATTKGTAVVTGNAEVHVRTHAGNDNVNESAALSVPLWAFGGFGFDALYGGAADDLLVGGLDQDYIYGRDGDDEIHGGDEDLPEPDGYGGYGYGGGDFLYGQDGDDTIHGEAGADWIEGGAGADTIDGGHEDANPAGASGQPWQSGGFGGGGYYDAGGGDYILGGTGEDFIRGDDETSDAGYGGNDYIDGGDGDDVIHGGHDEDYLVGGAGADRLEGGWADDLTDGGDGDDTYVFAGAVSLGLDNIAETSALTGSDTLGLFAA